MKIWIECDKCEGTGMTTEYSGSGGCLGETMFVRIVEALAESGIHTKKRNNILQNWRHNWKE